MGKATILPKRCFPGKFLDNIIISETLQIVLSEILLSSRMAQAPIIPGSEECGLNFFAEILLSLDVSCSLVHVPISSSITQNPRLRKSTSATRVAGS